MQTALHRLTEQETNDTVHSASHKHGLYATFKLFITYVGETTASDSDAIIC